MKDPSVWRIALASAIVGPLVAAVLPWKSPDAFLAGYWADPAVAVLLSSMVAAVGAVGLYLCVEAPLTRVARDGRYPPVAVMLASIGLSVLALVLMAVVLSLLFGLPVSGNEGRKAVLSVGEFLSFVVLGSYPVNAYFKTRDARGATLAARAEARALEMQINPHFFFNTLNTINALVPEKPELAQKSIRNLADLFRHSMETARETAIPLEREMAFVERYLEIEKARFGERLAYALPSKESMEGLEIPGLTLQPMVENAVRHGVAPLVEGGRVTMELSRRERGYTIAVTNPVEADTRRGGDFFAEGHALAMVRERLSLLYGRRAEVRIEPGKEMVRVAIVIPVNRLEENAARCVSW